MRGALGAKLQVERNQVQILVASLLAAPSRSPQLSQVRQQTNHADSRGEDLVPDSTREHAREGTVVIGNVVSERLAVGSGPKTSEERSDELVYKVLKCEERSLRIELGRFNMSGVFEEPTSSSRSVFYLRSFLNFVASLLAGRSLLFVRSPSCGGETCEVDGPADHEVCEDLEAREKPVSHHFVEPRVVALFLLGGFSEVRMSICSLLFNFWPRAARSGPSGAERWQHNSVKVLNGGYVRVNGGYVYVYHKKVEKELGFVPTFGPARAA